ncbi:nuclear transport factor 2 family protein [Luteimonas viscosa]|uniref:Nuclear transport factor 2 family protein n=1 Tax=Luteimonas viscosa TaxID=1132694 RepID=A0A5D4XSK3_9GAMM|nr:nuclear transport factor 2 family protein [Luteimonas viscosa]TYT25952.1 nuclear transport factor 2 family protein [Luteimonas viscosa]
MSEQNKTTLQTANAAIRRGDNEGFLAFCTEDIQWTTVGGETLDGKQAVRQWMRANYTKPPRFTVTDLVAEGELVVAIGEITMGDEAGNEVTSAYSDIWRFRDGRMAELRAFVIER